MTVNINIDNRTIVRILFVIVVVSLSLSFLAATKNVLTLLIISAFLAMALNPPVTYLSSKITGGSRGLATGMAYLTVIGAIGLFLWAIIPPAVHQSRDFLNELPTYIDELAEGDDSVSTFVRENNVDDEINEFVEDFRAGSVLGNSSSAVFSGIGRIGAAIVSVLTVLVLTFFMLIEGPGWLDKFWQAQPQEKREHRRRLGQKMYLVVTSYVNGQLLVALLAALSSLVAMLIAGIPQPVPLAALVGVFGLIPLVGATLGAVVVVLVALFQSIYVALGMLVFFLVYQQIENNAIQPLIQSKTLDVSPLLIFVAVLFGISVGGLLGAFIAIPVAAMARILFVDFVEQRAAEKKKPKSPIKKLIAKKSES